jgi:CubicO group peptidase (beta-lactamase class C family)
MKTITLFLISFALVINGLSAQQMHKLETNSFVSEFNVVGPFHQNETSPDNYFELLEIEFIKNEGAFNTNGLAIKPFVTMVGKNNTIDFNKILGDSLCAVAYAQFKLLSETDTDGMLVVSAQDGAKIYVNGINVKTFFSGGRNELCRIKVKKGENRIVIKVPNRDWGWNLSVKALDDVKANEYLEQMYAEEEEAVFLESDLIPKPSGNYGYTFYPGNFPKLVFEQPEIVKKKLGGNYSMHTRWFDRDLNEVMYPKEPGKYAYYSEIKGVNGLVLKKSATLFCAPQNWMGWTERLSAHLEYFPINGVPKSVWEKHREGINQQAGFVVFRSIMEQKDGAILLAFVDDMNQVQLEPSKMNTPIILNGDYHARLKQKILGVENKYLELRLPKSIQQKTPELIILSEHEDRRYDKLRQELIEVGNEWMKDGGSPFDMVIAKHGKVIFHDSWGEDNYGKFTINTPTEIASITKFFTGILFAQFVDQGILQIDDPVGKYLPDVPLTGPNAITLRHCFTHTAGLDYFAHGICGGMHNSWLENTLLHMIEDDIVGISHAYNGMGYDLAGKVMEVVSGKSIFRLFREYLYEPLEMNNTEHDWDLGFSVHSTAHDLAKVAQMVLNKGTYGSLQFFTEETYEKLLPIDLSQFYPDLKQKWGIGMTVMDWKVKDKNTNEEHFLVSDGIIGHGSATSSILWIIPKEDMIITQSRRRGNRNFGKNYQIMMKVVEKHLID